MTRAKIDKDQNDYLTPNSAPESERETAYKTQAEVEGDSVIADRAGNGDSVFKGVTKLLQGRRKRDQSTTGTPGSISEAEGPDAGGVGTAPAASDSPSLGMYSLNSSDLKNTTPDTRAILEDIALQAAEAFEILQENSTIPESMLTELQNCAEVIAKFFEYASQTVTGNPEAERSGQLPPEQPMNPQVKESKDFRIQYGDVISEKMTYAKACKMIREMSESGKYEEDSLNLIRNEEYKKMKADMESKPTMKAKSKICESVVSIFNKKIEEGSE